MPKKKICLRKKKRYTKKTPSVVGLETHKTKSDSKEGLNSEVSNADSIAKPASELLNMGNKVGLGLGNGEKEKSGNKSRGKIEIVIMCNIFISPLCIFLCLRILLEMVNTITLKFSNAHLLVNFETIL